MSTNSSSGESSEAIVVMSSREVSPKLVEVLFHSRVDTCMEEEINIAGYDGLGLVGSGPGATSLEFVGRWAIEDFFLIFIEADLDSLRQTFRVPRTSAFMLWSPHERAYVLWESCVALHIQSFNAGMRLPLDPFYRCVLRAYGLAPTQVALKGWSQMAESLYL
ncbi:Uncharacterized protein Adt_39411 [Abeliophyllum distichum]|uniref:Uncharacterized protein n=1 Tax=Abeliophyllum distichum TaxID=126358 RepID=A0ABD1Q514_9LAMI